MHNSVGMIGMCRCKGPADRDQLSGICDAHERERNGFASDGKRLGTTIWLYNLKIADPVSREEQSVEWRSIPSEDSTTVIYASPPLGVPYRISSSENGELSDWI